MSTETLLLIFISTVYLSTLNYGYYYLAFNPHKKYYLGLIVLLWSVISVLILASSLMAIALCIFIIDICVLRMQYIDLPKQARKYYIDSLPIFLDILWIAALAFNGSSPFSPACQFLFAIHCCSRCMLFPFNGHFLRLAQAPTLLSIIMHGGITSLPFLYLHHFPELISTPIFMNSIFTIACMSAIIDLWRLSQKNDYKTKLIFSTQMQMGFTLIIYCFISQTAALLHVIWHAFSKIYLLKDSNNILQLKDYQQSPLSKSYLLISLSCLGFIYYQQITFFGIHTLSFNEYVVTYLGILITTAICISLKTSKNSVSITGAVI